MLEHDGRAAMRGRVTVGAHIRQTRPHLWKLTLPANGGDRYGVAQLDDYTSLPRRAFPRSAPTQLSLRARVSQCDLPGTWGFGWWNDPFSVQLGLGGTSRRLPALPNAAWFFYASPESYLALHDNHPASGFLAATFSAPRLPWPILVLGLPVLPFLAWPWAARWIRRAGRLVVKEDAVALDLDPTVFHAYRMRWDREQVSFWVDDELRFTTRVSPRGPLGTVLWIDNQMMAFGPDGRIRFGTLGNAEAWLELEDIAVT